MSSIHASTRQSVDMKTGSVKLFIIKQMRLKDHFHCSIAIKYLQIVILYFDYPEGL